MRIGVVGRIAAVVGVDVAVGYVVVVVRALTPFWSARLLVLGFFSAGLESCPAAVLRFTAADGGCFFRPASAQRCVVAASAQA